MKIYIFFYSMYGHMYRMTKAAAEGASRVKGAEVKVFRVPETLSREVLEQMGAVEAQKDLADIPVAEADDLADADGIILGVPTRYGNMCGQMRQFLDGTVGLWSEHALVGKVGSVMSSSATQHGGQETTIVSTHYTLLHLGMIIVGLPYSFEGQMGVEEIKGGTPYGASTIVGPNGERMPSENELEAARYQGQRVAEITKKLVG
jgi:NAD(P)H dehydrogenase (quinone)